MYYSNNIICIQQLTTCSINSPAGSTNCTTQTHNANVKPTNCVNCNTPYIIPVQSIHSNHQHNTTIQVNQKQRSSAIKVSKVTQIITKIKFNIQTHNNHLQTSLPRLQLANKRPTLNHQLVVARQTINPTNLHPQRKQMPIKYGSNYPLNQYYQCNHNPSKSNQTCLANPQAYNNLTL
eukprot:gene13135-8981_t